MTGTEWSPSTPQVHSGKYTYRARSCNSTCGADWSNTASVNVTVSVDQKPPVPEAPTFNLSEQSLTGAYDVKWITNQNTTSYVLLEFFNGGSTATTRYSDSGLI